jgi:hypothetical protein
MAISPSPIDLAGFPYEFLAGVRRQAQMDAKMVIYFLEALANEYPELGWQKKKPSIPMSVVVGLGAALRMWLWEDHGIQIHREAGLPSAVEAVKDVFRSPMDSGAAARTAELPARVMALFGERLAWEAPPGTPVLLGDIDDDDVDAVADFLWRHRHDDLSEFKHQRGNNDEA